MRIGASHLAALYLEHVQKISEQGKAEGEAVTTRSIVEGSIDGLIFWSMLNWR